MTAVCDRPVSSRKAADICRNYDPGDEAVALLVDDPSPSEFFDALRDRAFHEEAVRFVAHFLPARSAIWWGCLCAWHVAPHDPPAADVAAFEAAVHWVLDPSEENRRRAEPAGRAINPPNPAACLALATAWSGGSLTPPGCPVVAPSPYLTAKAVAGAIQMAASQGDPDSLDDRYRQFLQFGLEVANGKNRWDK